MFQLLSSSLFLVCCDMMLMSVLHLPCLQKLIWLAKT